MNSLDQRRRRFGAVVISLILLLSLASCSPRRIGWGLLLWTVQGTQAKAGTIVPVYLKSNITKVFVIGLESEQGRKIEVPLWQLELYRSKSAANKRVAALGSLVSIYLVAVKDGLPVREKPDNISKKVYRLRDGEMVKALELVKGEDLYTGKQKLPGDWYKVLSMDGTLGYSFSYSMRVFDESRGEVPALERSQTDPEALNELFSKAWRPAWYATMMEENLVDLDYFDLRFGFFSDAINKQIRVEMPGDSKTFSYNSITQESGWLEFGPSDLRVKLEGQDSILVAWGPIPDGEPEDLAGWKAGDSYLRFIVPPGDLRVTIRAEEARRSSAMKDFFASLSGKNASALDSQGLLKTTSVSGSSLELWPSGSFSWKGAQALPAGFAPEEGRDEEMKGSAVFGLRLAPELSTSWQGGFSLYSDSGRARADYLYRIGLDDIVLARATPVAPGMLVSGIDNRLGMISFAFSR
ncbi:MAG: SH3 domain-containing protein [Spirochaetes bacterium]|nr:SH3 domain-containing protein [Spirochaetota bacterium]